MHNFFLVVASAAAGASASISPRSLSYHNSVRIRPVISPAGHDIEVCQQLHAQVKTIFQAVTMQRVAQSTRASLRAAVARTLSSRVHPSLSAIARCRQPLLNGLAPNACQRVGGDFTHISSRWLSTGKKTVPFILSGRFNSLMIKSGYLQCLARLHYSLPSTFINIMLDMRVSLFQTLARALQRWNLCNGLWLKETQFGNLITFVKFSQTRYCVDKEGINRNHSADTFSKSGIKSAADARV